MESHVLWLLILICLFFYVVRYNKFVTYEKSEKFSVKDVEKVREEYKQAMLLNSNSNNSKSKIDNSAEKS